MSYIMLEILAGTVLATCFLVWLGKKIVEHRDYNKALGKDSE